MQVETNLPGLTPRQGATAEAARTPAAEPMASFSQVFQGQGFSTQHQDRHPEETDRAVEVESQDASASEQAADEADTRTGDAPGGDKSDPPEAGDALNSQESAGLQRGDLGSGAMDIRYGEETGDIKDAWIGVILQRSGTAAGDLAGRGSMTPPAPRDLSRREDSAHAVQSGPLRDGSTTSAPESLSFGIVSRTGEAGGSYLRSAAEVQRLPVPDKLMQLEAGMMRGPAALGQAQTAAAADGKVGAAPLLWLSDQGDGGRLISTGLPARPPLRDGAVQPPATPAQGRTAAGQVHHSSPVLPETAEPAEPELSKGARRMPAETPVGAARAAVENRSVAQPPGAATAGALVGAQSDVSARVTRFAALASERPPGHGAAQTAPRTSPVADRVPDAPAGRPKGNDIAKPAVTPVRESLAPAALSEVYPGQVAAPAAAPREAGHQAAPPVQAAQILARDIALQLLPGLRAVPGEFTEITLRPDELGRVQMRMSGQDGQILLQVFADRPETQELLRRHIDLVERAFRELGYTDIAFEFASSDRQRRQPGAASPPAPETGDAPEEDLAVPTSGPGQTATTRLDIRV